VIEWFKATSDLAKAIIAEAMNRTYSAPLPPGFYAPGRVLHSNFYDFMGWVYA